MADDRTTGARDDGAPARLSTRRACAICAVLLALAAVLRFALRGYDVLALGLVVIAVVVVLARVASPALFGAAVGLVAIAGLAVCITEIPIIAHARTDAGDDTRFLVVLGARVDSGGAPSVSLLLRLESTLAFLEAHPQAAAILSGGQGPDEDMPEAEAMYRWLVDRGIDPARLLVEPCATSTRENLAYSFAMIRERGYDPDGCTAVVSSSYHLYRAKLIAQQQGVSVAGVRSSPGNPLVALNYYLREAPAVWKELLVRGR